MQQLDVDGIGRGVKVARVIVEWDDPNDPKGNVQHIARHSVTQAEVEYVLNSLRSTSTPEPFQRPAGHIRLDEDG